MQHLRNAIASTLMLLGSPAWADTTMPVWGVWSDGIIRLEFRADHMSMSFKEESATEWEPEERMDAVYNDKLDPDGTVSVVVQLADGSGLILLPQGDTMKVVFPGMMAGDVRKIGD